MELFFKHLFDIALGTLILRIVLGWLISYPRLVRLLLMLLTLFGLVILVRWAELPFSGLMAWVLLAPIVVVVLLSFLPELGKIYQSASRGNLFGQVQNKSDDLIPVLADVLGELVRKKMGALIVLPSSKDAEGLIQGGEEVDARVNASLLLSLFNPNCPRHDGAAVIINNRLSRIGAFLPLAQAEGTDMRYGTRHLAALGLTQRSDAHVLVVSEERQVVSYVHDGRIRELPTQEGVNGLSQALQATLGEQAGVGKSKRGLILSAGLWILCGIVTVVGSLNMERWKEHFVESSAVLTYMPARVELSAVPKQFFVEELKPTEVTLFMRTSQILKPAGGLTVTVDLRGVKAGKYTLPLSEANLSGLPRDTKIERFEPAFIQCIVAEVRRMRVGVERAEVKGLREGLKLKSYRWERASFMAEVRDTKWKLSSTVKALPVDLSGLEKPGTYQLAATLSLPPTVLWAEEQAGDFNLVVELGKK
jgi:diadenylate cyclase